MRFRFIRIILFWALVVASVQTRAQNPDIFFYVCDDTNELASIDRTSGNETIIGSTGVSNIESIAFWPGTNTLYAADNGNFGTINTSTGAFTLIGDVDATGLADGNLGLLTLGDIDGMTFDPWTGILWASSRRVGDFDIMFQIDITTGAFIEDAFGPGLDYIVIDGTGIFLDVDDLAISPTTGRLFASSTQAGVAQLLEVNKSTGAVTVVAELQFSDVEGMAYNNDGTF
ncbi:MAG: hypothetical protein AAFN93_02730 [Bacteroidota bacterium]